MKMKRKTISSQYFDSFQNQVQMHLDLGWTPIPGTVSITASPTAFFGFIILEKSEE